MVGSGNVKAAVGDQAAPKLPSAAEAIGKGQVLHGRAKLPHSPAKLELGGFAVVLTIGYFTLYSHKKPEATALERC